MVTQLTKQDVIQLWNECQSYLKSKFPKYHKSIQKYQFRFGRKRSSYGTCKYDEQVIEIHMYLCRHAKKEDVKDTILHEMAHAIDKEVNGLSSGHGLPWKKIATEIGAKAKSSSRKGLDVVKKSKYVMVVKVGNKYEFVANKHRKSRNYQINKPVKGMWLRGRKKQTLNKVYYFSWEKFIQEYKAGNIDLKSIDMTEV